MLILRLAAATLLALALPAQIPDFTPPTPLLGAAVKGDTAAVARLLNSSANPNADRFFGFPALTIAAMRSNLAMSRALLQAGAKVDEADANGNTPLLWAVAQDVPNPLLVEELLQRGADVKHKNKTGETALVFALRRGDLATAKRLRQAGADQGEIVKEAVERALAMMQKSAPQFVKVSGCSSCHHQSVPQLAIGAARARGYAIDEAAAAHQVKTVMAMFKPIREKLADGSMTPPNPPISLGYSLLGLHAEGYAPDENTTAMAASIARMQAPDGSFGVMPVRPPQEWSAFTGTALGMRALQLYAGKDEEPIVRACNWLERTPTATSEERAMRVLGLEWCASPASEGAIRDLLAAQRPDGGWAQLDTIETDAYATGQALAALALAGRGQGDAYERGIAYLLRTQQADGTWHVRTRANAVQPLKDSGFPHGRDQWISVAGTGWATYALALSQPRPGHASTE